MFGYGFWLRPAIPGWGLWCVCLGLGFSCTPLFLAGVLGRVPSCAPSARAPSPGGRAACGEGLRGGRCGRGFTPPPRLFFLVFLAAGGGICGFGSQPSCVVALLLSPLPVSVLGPLVSAPPPPLVWVFFLLCPCPCGRWPATSPLGVCAGVSGVSFPPALRRLCARGGRLFLAGLLPAGRGGSPESYRRAPRVSTLALPGFGAARLCCVGARLRGCATVPTVFLLSGWPVDVCSCMGGASPYLCSFVWGGRFACSSLCPAWVGERTGRQTVWLTGLLLVLWVAAGRAPAQWVVWVMNTHGLVACPVALGSCSAGGAVTPGGFVRSWVRGGGAVPCPPGPAVSVWWWQVELSGGNLCVRAASGGGKGLYQRAFGGL